MEASQHTIIAFVGMPGSGKSEAASYLHQKGFSFIRFGQQTDEGLQEEGLPITPENEELYREKIRKEMGMAAFAIKANSKIEAMLQKEKCIVIDGLYSWEEYTYLKKIYKNLFIVHVYAERAKRYARLEKRAIRPIQFETAEKRDFMEIENLNKGGPIAIADFVITNSEDDLQNLHQQIEKILKKITGSVEKET